MKRSLRIFWVSALFLAGLAGQAMAFGWGAYVEGAQGQGEFEYSEYGDEFDVDAKATGYGLVFDTDLRGQQRFNLRFSLGYDKLDLEDDFGDTLNLEGVVMSGTFGFPLTRQTNYHWWIGPQMRVGFYSGDVDNHPAADYELASFGLGGALGFNYITRSNICISTSVGFLFSGYGGEKSLNGYDEDIEGSASTVFANLAFLFSN